MKVDKVIPINKKKFYKEYNVKEVNLTSKGLFTEKDIYELRKFDNSSSLASQVENAIKYISFGLTNPYFIQSFLIPNFIAKIRPQTIHRSKSWGERMVMSKTIKASIAAAFKPHSILEIGTYLGVGAASLKVANPKATVITMCPKDNGGANNPLPQGKIGYFFRKKKIGVKQIWADSTQFNYSKLPQIDFTYIDGNHDYQYVYSDLVNTSKITRKCILLDDYIPLREAKKRNMVYGPWNDGVVKATNRFLKENPTLFEKAYWIEGTKFCVLVK